VLTGGCLQLGGEGLPFAPVVEALRGAVQALGVAELRRLAGEDASELARLVPALRRADRRRPRRPPELTPSSQLRLFEALLGLFGVWRHIGRWWWSSRTCIGRMPRRAIC
jgi:hypothetical protein